MRKGPMYYSRGYSPRRKKRNYKAVFILLLILILVLVYTLFLSRVFKIKEIMISGSRVITSEEIKDSINKSLSKKFLFVFDKNNIFLADGGGLKKIIFSNFSRVSSVEINKDIFKKTIDIKITERSEIGIFCRGESSFAEATEDKCYYIDENGVVFEKAPQTSGSLILAMKDNSDGNLELGKNVLSKELIGGIIDLKNYLSDHLGLRVLDFVMEKDAPNDLRVNTNEGWYILFDKSRNLNNQLDALKLVLEEKIKENRNKLEYVDLRIENRVYYK